MSAAELTANGGKISAGVARLVDDAIVEIAVGQRLLLQLQRDILPSGVLGLGEPRTVDPDKVWRRLETIDDHLHNALAKLGD